MTTAKECNIRKRLALVRLVPVYPDSVHMNDICKALGMDPRTWTVFLANVDGLAEWNNWICFPSLKDKEKAEKKYENQLAECQRKDNGGDL